MTAPATTSNPAPVATGGIIASPRAVSIDALRGLIVFTMIFVNGLASVSSKIVPAWMRHFHGKSGMTFVDLVFPAFLFIVSMSIPLALGSRLRKSEPVWKVLLHVLLRTAALLAIGILMVHQTPSTEKLSWATGTGGWQSQVSDARWLVRLDAPVLSWDSSRAFAVSASAANFSSG